MKNYKEFINEKFGEIRVIEIEGHNWFIGRDIVTALGYKTDGSHSYTDYINKFVSNKGKLKMNNHDIRLFGIENAGRKGGNSNKRRWVKSISIIFTFTRRTRISRMDML